MNSQHTIKSAQKGRTLIEVAAVIALTFVLGAIVFRVVGAQSAITTATATQIYQTSQVMANNWKRLSQAAGVPYDLGNTYWQPTNPLLACTTTTCATSGDNWLDGQRTIRILMEGTSAMNPAYASSWTNAHLTPMAGLQKIGAYYYLSGSWKPASSAPLAMWGSGYSGATYWAMGPILIYHCNNVSEAVAVELAQRYGGVTITSASQTQTTGPVQFLAADTCGIPGTRPVALVFQ